MSQRIIDEALAMQSKVDDAIRKALETLALDKDELRMMQLGKDYFSVNILVAVADQNPTHIGTLEDINLTSSFTVFIEKKQRGAST